MSERVLCSDCFRDQGLKLDAYHLGSELPGPCPKCGSEAGKKLSKDTVAQLAFRYFVRGTYVRRPYGSAPRIQFNDRRSTDIKVAPWLEADIKLFENCLGIGFFHYGPRLWMIGEVEPLKALLEPETRSSVIARILAEYPRADFPEDRLFYRIRKFPKKPEDFGEYDSPPETLLGVGRLDTAGHPVMYASEDLDICIHECRVTAEDDVYVATLSAKRPLKLLDLTEILEEPGVTEFESLDMAVHMLFLAPEHSYSITRAISLSARMAGFDGIMYPSYFSLLRTGMMPFETTYGIAHRRIEQMRAYEKSKMIPNLGFFGYPIAEGKLQVHCLDKLILRGVHYQGHFGPVGFE